MKDEKVWLSLYIPKSLKKTIETLAEKEGRSVNNYVERLLAESV